MRTFLTLILLTLSVKAFAGDAKPFLLNCIAQNDDGSINHIILDSKTMHIIVNSKVHKNLSFRNSKELNMVVVFTDDFITEKGEFAYYALSHKIKTGDYYFVEKNAVTYKVIYETELSCYTKDIEV